MKADAFYGATANFKICARYKARIIPKFKSNTKPTENGSDERGRVARFWAPPSYVLWLESAGYGKRWKIGSAFSDFKRIISEHVTARTRQGMNIRAVTMVKASDIHKEVRNELFTVIGNGAATA